MTTKKNPIAAEPPVGEFFALAPDGTRLYARRRVGPSPVTAVLCDGICCDGFIFKYLWDDLARTVSVVHWNYRGHGRSAQPENPVQITVPDHAADLDAVRKRVGDPPVVLVGHSFGTQVALEAYRLRRDKIRAMVFLCGSFGRVTHYFKGTDTLASVLPRLRELSANHPKVARALWSRVPPKVALKIGLLTGDLDARTVRPEDVEPYFRHVAHIDFPMFVKMLEHAGEHSAEDLLPEIEDPGAGHRRGPRLLHAAGAFPPDGGGHAPRGTGDASRRHSRGPVGAKRAVGPSDRKIPGGQRRHMRALAAAVVALLALVGCDKGKTEVAPAASARAAPPVSASPSAVPALPSASASAAAQPAVPEQLASLRGQSDGTLVGRLASGPDVRVVVATKEAPLASDAPAAWAAIAGFAAPGVRVPTTLRLVPLAELSKAAQGVRAKALVRNHARVLADGTVSVAILRVPEDKLRHVDLGAATDGTIVAGWETKLMTAAVPSQPERALLAAYQSLLAVDYLTGNLVRGPVLLDEPASRIVAVEDNDVFSPHGRDGRVGDPLARLSRHLHWSKKLVADLRAISRPALDEALRSPRGTLLVTPKQVDEVLSRRDALVRTALRRGSARALTLP